MKKIILLALISVSQFIYSQDLGRIEIRNGFTNYPKFIASLNGMRLTNDYNALSVFRLLDENIYKLKLLQAGSTTMLSFTLSSEPKYLSKYVIIKDNIGNYSVMLESKSIMLEDIETVATTPAVAPPPATTVIVTQTVAATPTVTPITAIDSQTFNERMGAIKKVTFDSNRLPKSKQVFSDEHLTVNQVMEVVKLFTFDDAKLDFSKWAYKMVIDKKNYYKIDDLLMFTGSKTDLGNFVKNQPK